jgi:hypothetical protein
MKINSEVDHLIVYKNLDGTFLDFNWYPDEKTTKEKLITYINKEKKKKKKETGRIAEYITDKLLREICAYTDKARPLVRLMDEVEEMKQDMRNNVRNIRSSLDELDSLIIDIAQRIEKP